MIRDKSSKHHILFLVALVIFFVPCLWYIFNAFRTDEIDTGCHPLPTGFSEEDLIGTWTAKSSVLGISDTLYIQADGRYKQTIHISGPPNDIDYEGDWQSWWFEPRSNGTGYLHLEGFRTCAASPETSCSWVYDGQYSVADACSHEYVQPNSVGEAVLVVYGIHLADPNTTASHPIALELFRGFESSGWGYSFEKP